MVLFPIMSLFLLGTIAWEDLRERSIHWWLLPSLAICMVAPALHTLPGYEFMRQVAFNLAFLGLQWAAILLFLMARHRAWVDPMDRYIGSGDLLFFVVLALGLSRANFVLFYLSGLALCIPAYAVLVRWKPSTPRTVPTAGFLALYLLLWSALDLVGHAPALYTGSVAEFLLAHGG
jgi:hypothetical protein